MAKKKSKNFNKTILLSALLLVVGYVLVILHEQSQELTYLKSLQSQYEERILQTEEENNLIKKNIENAHTDKYIEKIAREQLKMIGSDEVIFIDLGRRGR